MSKISKVTDSELEILKILWDSQKELSMSEIRNLIKDEKDWDNSTIKTLVRRLCNKDIIISVKRDILYYKPLITRDTYSNFKTKSLIDKIYEGSAKKLISNLVSSDTLEKKDIDELRQIFIKRCSDD